MLIRTALSIPSNIDGLITDIAKLPANSLSVSRQLLAFIVTPQLAAVSVSGYTSNPFNIVQTGYPLDPNPAYTQTGDINLNNPPDTFDFDMPPEVMWEKYECQVYIDGTPEEIAAHQQQFFGRVDGVPYEVPVAVNPCMLDKLVSEAAGGLYGGDLGDGINNYIPSPTSPASSSTPASSPVPLCEPGVVPKLGDPPCIL